MTFVLAQCGDRGCRTQGSSSPAAQVACSALAGSSGAATCGCPDLLRVYQYHSCSLNDGIAQAETCAAGCRPPLPLGAPAAAPLPIAMRKRSLPARLISYIQPACRAPEPAPATMACLGPSAALLQPCTSSPVVLCSAASKHGHGGGAASRQAAAVQLIGGGWAVGDRRLSSRPPQVR